MAPNKPLSEREVGMILSAICFFNKEADLRCDKRYPVLKTAAECLGLSLATIKRVNAANKKNKDEDAPA